MFPALAPPGHRGRPSGEGGARVNTPTTGLPALVVVVVAAAARRGFGPRPGWGLTSPRGARPCVRIGRAVKYSPAALAAWIEALQARRQPIAKPQNGRPPGRSP